MVSRLSDDRSRINRAKRLVGEQRAESSAEEMDPHPHLHLNTLHLYAPRIGGLVQRHLHRVRDRFPLRQQLGQVARTEHVPQRGGRQQARRVAVVRDLHYRVERVADAIVHDGIDRHGDGIARQHLLRRHIERHGTQVDLAVVVDAGQHEEHAGPAGPTGPQPAEPKDDRPLVLLHHLEAEEQRDREGQHHQHDRAHGRQHFHASYRIGFGYFEADAKSGG
uniref:Uncharacterized protein n=1 Tax=Anopheles coluzzii TaxID=1518534 RepID=A0A8W7PA53_ANOCL